MIMKPIKAEAGEKKLFSVADYDVFVSKNQVTIANASGSRSYFSSLKAALWNIVQEIGDTKLSKEKNIELKQAVKILTDNSDRLWKEISEKIDERFPEEKIGKYEI